MKIVFIMELGHGLAVVLPIYIIHSLDAVIFMMFQTYVLVLLALHFCYTAL